MTEEITKVATTTVEALKATPMILALVIFNILFMFLVVYLSLKNGERWDKQNDHMHELVAKTLAVCHPSGAFRLQSEESRPVEVPPLPQPRPPDAQ